MTTGRCDRCGEPDDLQPFALNQKTVLSMCADCIQAERDKRSEVAIASKAGRPPKTPSQIDDQLWRCLLNSGDSRTLEAWFEAKGYTGTRGEKLKKHLRAIVKTAGRAKATTKAKRPAGSRTRRR